MLYTGSGRGDSHVYALDADTGALLEIPDRRRSGSFAGGGEWDSVRRFVRRQPLCSGRQQRHPSVAIPHWLAQLPSPAVANGVVYVGAYALDAGTGTLLWQDQSLQCCISSSAIASGVVYIAASDGTIYAFGLPTNLDFAHLQPESPSRAKGDVRRDGNDNGGRYYGLGGRIYVFGHLRVSICRIIKGQSGRVNTAFEYELMWKTSTADNPGPVHRRSAMPRRFTCNLPVLRVFAATVGVLAAFVTPGIAQEPVPLATRWNEKVLLNFNGVDGRVPPSRPNLRCRRQSLWHLVRGRRFYGYGTVFELSPVQGGGWTQTILYSFKYGTDGAYPGTGLTFDAAGNLYGTTGLGGTYNWGTVFELSPNSGGGWKYTLVYSFSNDPDAAGPGSSLVMGADGNSMAQGSVAFTARK